MNFSPDIADRYEFIVNQFENKKKWLEDFQPVILERAEVEIAYAKNLAKVAQLYEKYSTKNGLEKGVASIIMSARSGILTQSEQALEYAQQLKTEIIGSIKVGIKKQQEELANLRQKVGFLKSELARNLGELEQQKLQYYKNYKMFQRNKEQIKNLSLQETNPVLAVVSENEKLLLKNQGLVEEQLKSYNTFLDQYFTEIAQANKQQDQMEDSRVEILKDALLKSLIYQMSALKNVEYDYQGISKKIEFYKRQDPKPLYIEQQERTMLSKLNSINYLNYIHQEFSVPDVDRAISKQESNHLELMEINRSLKRFLDQYSPKKQRSLQASPMKPGQSQIGSSENLSNSTENFFPAILQRIFVQQVYLDNAMIQKFKERIDSSEKERILFTIALNNFSLVETSVSSSFNEKSISDLIFLVSSLFERSEQFREVDLIERCYFSFHRICKFYIPQEDKQQVYIESLAHHHVLASKDLWAQDSIKKINQSIVRDNSKLNISKTVFAEQQIKQDILKWKELSFSQTFQIQILKDISTAFKLDAEKRQFYENVILDKEKIIKKPIFSKKLPENGRQSNSEQSNKLFIQEEAANLKEEKEEDTQESKTDLTEKPLDKQEEEIEKSQIDAQNTIAEEMQPSQINGSPTKKTE